MQLQLIFSMSLGNSDQTENLLLDYKINGLIRMDIEDKTYQTKVLINDTLWV